MQEKVIPDISHVTEPDFQGFLSAGYHLDIETLEPLSLESAVILALEKENETAREDALALHSHLY